MRGEAGRSAAAEGLNGDQHELTSMSEAGTVAHDVDGWEYDHLYCCTPPGEKKAEEGWRAKVEAVEGRGARVWRWESGNDLCR